MAKDKAEPNKSIRTTIAVFLRHAEKRHKDALAKEAKEREAAAAATEKSGGVDAAGEGQHNGNAQTVPNQNFPGMSRLVVFVQGASTDSL